MPPPVIEAGPLTLRPFHETDIAWVYEVSQDPAIQRNLPEIFAPYRMEHAAHFVRQQTLAAWDEGRRAEFLVVEATSGTRLGRVGLDLRPHEPGNVASRRVAEKAGFLMEGTLRHICPVRRSPNVRSDTYAYLLMYAPGPLPTLGAAGPGGPRDPRVE